MGIAVVGSARAADIVTAGSATVATVTAAVSVTVGIATVGIATVGTVRVDTVRVDTVTSAVGAATAVDTVGSVDSAADAGTGVANPGIELSPSLARREPSVCRFLNEKNGDTFLPRNLTDNHTLTTTERRES